MRLCTKKWRKEKVRETESNVYIKVGVWSNLSLYIHVGKPIFTEFYHFSLYAERILVFHWISLRRSATKIISSR